MSNFTNLLHTPADSIEQPQSTPVGTWRFDINVVRITEPEEDDDAGVFLFGMKPVEPGPDVDPSEVEKFDAEEGQEWLRFWVRDQRGAWRVRRFLEATGVDMSADLESVAKSAEGYSVMAYVDHEPNKNDPEGPPRVRFSDFAPV